MPVLLILLLVIFGSLAAAWLPVAIGGIAILGSFTVLRLLTLATTVSVYSVNITTILGLGLAIDYGAVHRDQVPRGTAPGADGRAGGGPDGGHRGPDRRGLRRHGRGRADQPDAVPGGLPAVDGLRRGGHRRGGHAGRADRAARAARRPRPPGQRAAHPPFGAPPVRGPARTRTSGGWYRLARSVDAPARGLRRGDRDRAAGPGRAVPAHLLGWHRRPGAARRPRRVRQVSETLDSDFPVNSTDPDRGARHRGTAANPAG